jgi:hypothetical protein
LKPLRWAAVLFLLAGLAAAPLNLLHAHFFSGAEIARVPLQRQGTISAPQAYPPLIINLDPAQSPLVVSIEATYAPNPIASDASNRYTTRLISGSNIAAQSEAALAASATPTKSGTAVEPQRVTTTLLRTKINTPGLYSVLASEAAAPGIVFTQAALTVRANARRADAVNVLAGIAFILIGAVTLFATGKRRSR